MFAFWLAAQIGRGDDRESRVEQRVMCGVDVITDSTLLELLFTSNSSKVL